MARSKRTLTALLLALATGAAAAGTLVPSKGGFNAGLSSYSARIEPGKLAYHAESAIKPAFIFSLRSVRVGDKVLRPGSSRVEKLSSDTVTFRHKAAFSEIYTARENGVEQSWVIDSRPKSGGIVINGIIHTTLHPIKASRGWRFVDGKGSSVLRYGSVTVIDANERKYRCMPTINGDHLAISVPESYVKTARFPIVIDPIVGPENQLCSTFSAATNSQDGVQMAAGLNGFLAVWQDSRGIDLDIFATRLGPNGDVLDPAGIAISTATAEQITPAVAWNGKVYFVVWADRRLGVQHIYGARVLSTGEVIDKQGILISGSSGTQAYPKVASDGAGFEVVWQDSRGGTQDIYGCKISGDGALSRVMGISTQAGSNEENPDIAYNGTTFLVVWRDSRNASITDTDIYGCRVAKNGVRLAGDIIISCDLTGANGITGAQNNPKVCAFDSTWMVAWEDNRSTTSGTDIYAARVNSDGVVMDRNGVQVVGATGIQELPGIGYDGSKILIAWRDRTSRYIQCARIGADGILQDRTPYNVSAGTAGSGGVSVAGCVNGGFEVGWNTLSMAGNDILTARVPRSGAISPVAGSLTSLGLDDQEHYCVADNGREYAVVWAQMVNGNWDILAARVSYSGQLLTPVPVNLTATLYTDQTQPAIAWNGTEYLVTWTDDSSFMDSNLDIRGMRIDSTLRPIDTTPLLICGAADVQQNSWVASNGKNFLVVWEDYRNSSSTSNYYTDIYDAIVDANGIVTNPMSGVNLVTGDQRNPRAASDGTNYYVVWEDYRNGYSLIYGAKVSSSGDCTNSSGTAMPATSYSQATPDICYGNGYYFVTWSDSIYISGCRISASGTITDPSGIRIDTGTTSKKCPSVCWDGSRYEVVWEDYRSSFVGNADIYYASVGGTGVLSPDPKVALVSDLIPQLRPRVFGHSDTGVLFYSRYNNFVNGTCVVTLTQQGMQQVDTIAAAKLLPAGSFISLHGKVVTAVFPDSFYVEEVNRSNGIKVISTITTHIGDIVDVTGVIGITDGERQIMPGTVTAMGVASNPPKPIGIRGEWLGGAPLNANTPGVAGGTGANNLGQLITTWGTVSSLGSGYFYIDAKPGVSIKIKSGSLSQPKVGDFVSITGISSCEIVAGAINRAVLPRQQSDIRALK